MCSHGAEPPSVAAWGGRWRQRFLRLATVVIGVVFAWLILEIVLRIGFDYLPGDVQAALENVHQVPWDDAPLVPMPPWTGDTDYQTVLRPGLTDYRVGYGESLFHINSINLWGGRVGFRTGEPQWPVDIAVVGDSFSVCWTEQTDCWVAHLHNDYAWSVMDLGLAGTGARSHLMVLKNFVIPLEPRVVIWQWYGNDANDDYGFGLLRGEYESFGMSPKLTYEPDFGSLAEYSAVYAVLRDQLWTAAHGKPKDWGQYVTVQGAKLRVGDEYNLNGFDLSRAGNALGWDQGVTALEEASRIVTDELNASLLIVLIPSKEEVYADYIEDVLGKDYLDNLRDGRLRMLALCADNDWRCLDMLEPLQAAVSEGQQVYYNVDLHLNPDGNAVVAEAIAGYLTDAGLLE